MEIHSSPGIPPGARAPGTGQSSPNSAPVAPTAPGAAAPLPGAAARTAGPLNGPPETPAAERSRPPLPPRPPRCGRDRPGCGGSCARLTPPLTGETWRRPGEPKAGGCCRLRYLNLFPPSPPHWLPLAPSAPRNSRGAAPPLPMYTQPHAARRPARPPQMHRPLVQQPARQPETLQHWLAALLITARPAPRPTPPLPGHLGGVKTAV